MAERHLPEKFKGMQDRKLEVRSAPPIPINSNISDKELTRRHEAVLVEGDEQIELMRLYIKEHGRKK